jgi:magnesium chelatase accessory protein
MTMVSSRDEERRIAPELSHVPFDWPLRDSSSMVAAAGTTWHVQRTGQGQKLLLIHGTAASTHTWRDLVPLLEDEYDIVAIDLPGHGYSQRLPDRSMSLPSLSSALGELLVLLDFEPEYVAGHSAGAAIALRMTLDGLVHPRCVLGLNAALLPFGGSLRNVIVPMTQLFATTRLMPALLARRARDARAIDRVLSGTGSRLDEEGVAYYQRLLQRESHVAAVLAMMASWDLEPLIADLANLRTPLRLFVADGDKAVSPREADRIAATLGNADVVRLGRLGHLAHEERPAEVVSIIRENCAAPGTNDV